MIRDRPVLDRLKRSELKMIGEDEEMDRNSVVPQTPKRDPDSTPRGITDFEPRVPHRQTCGTPFSVYRVLQDQVSERPVLEQWSKIQRTNIRRPRTIIRPPALHTPSFLIQKDSLPRPYGVLTGPWIKNSNKNHTKEEKEGRRKREGERNVRKK